MKQTRPFHATGAFPRTLYHKVSSSALSWYIVCCHHRRCLRPSSMLFRRLRLVLPLSARARSAKFTRHNLVPWVAHLNPCETFCKRTVPRRLRVTTSHNGSRETETLSSVLLNRSNEICEGTEKEIDVAISGWHWRKDRRCASMWTMTSRRSGCIWRNTPH